MAEAVATGFIPGVLARRLLPLELVGCLGVPEGAAALTAAEGLAVVLPGGRGTCGCPAPTAGGLETGVVAIGFIPGVPARRLVPLELAGGRAPPAGCLEAPGEGTELTAVGGFADGPVGKRVTCDCAGPPTGGLEIGAGVVGFIPGVLGTGPLTRGPGDVGPPVAGNLEVATDEGGLEPG